MVSAAILFALLHNERWAREIMAPLFRTVVIDPGHGGGDPGAVGQGLLEKDLCLTVSLQLRDLLQEAGFRVVLTRDTDEFVSLGARAALANRVPGAIFVSVHFNKATHEEARGIETFFPPRLDEPPGPESLWDRLVGVRTPRFPRYSEFLAAEVQLALLAETGATNRGIKEGRFYVLRNTRMPAILVEGGFVSNAMEAALLENPAYQRRIAKGVAEGIARFVRRAADGEFEEKEGRQRLTVL